MTTPVVPIVELPTFRDSLTDADLKRLFEGARQWHEHAKSIIVIAKLSNIKQAAKYYVDVSRKVQLPKMIPGTKAQHGGTDDPIEHMGDEQAWTKLGDTLRKCASHCGVTKAYIDLETLYKHGDTHDLIPVTVPYMLKQWIVYPALDSYYESRKQVQFENLRQFPRERLITIDRHASDKGRPDEAWRVFGYRVNKLLGGECWGIVYNPECMSYAIGDGVFDAVCPFPGWSQWKEPIEQWTQSNS